MKQKRLKIYLKFGILLFGTSILFNSCQKDEISNAIEDFAKTEQIDYAKLSLNHITLDDLINSENTIDFNNGVLSKISFDLNSNLNLKSLIH